tara:strand:- start:642 stop:1604 length:963 start_codon:yes stop_codon:yes gene_type:complete
MKILAVQNRMGIGDMIIFLPFIEAIAKKFNTKIYLLVKENSKAFEYLQNNKFIEQIIILDRNNRDKKGSHDGIIGSVKLVNKLKEFKFDKIFIFNSSLRFNLIARFAFIKQIYQYPLFNKKNQHIIATAKKFLKNSINIDVESNPEIFIDGELLKYNREKYFDHKNKNVLLGIGGSGVTKRIPAKTYLTFMKKCLENYKCKFFLATGTSDGEQKILNQIINTDLKKFCIRLDHLTISETLPFIKNCNISICNDSSFSHLSAALGLSTIVLMADTPLLYGSYSPKMFPIIPDGVDNVSHDTLGKEYINPEKIFNRFKKLID